MADKYLLRVTAGPSYDTSTHHQVSVNTPHPTHVSTDLCTASISVRVQNYHGLPHGSPSTSPYFSHAPHTHDKYSISFRLIPRKPISGSALVFGNDFDHPVRDRLPPGFGTAFNIFKWMIDPGVDGDVHADKPHLYGNALSSLNVLRVGEKVDDSAKHEDNAGQEIGIVEGGEGDGEKFRKDRNVPGDAAARKKWYLGDGRTKEWEWEAGRVYWGDFFNPYLDFNEFALKLPGFSLSILGYLGGDDYLRYVLKNKDTGEVCFVVVFALTTRDQVGERGEGQPTESQKEGLRGAVSTEEKKIRTDGEGQEEFQPKAEDLD